MELTIVSRSENGPVRTNNEDCVAHWLPESEQERLERGGAVLIADGVGGQQDGEVASKLAVDTALEAFRSAKPGMNLNGLLWQMVNQANLAVYDANQNRMGTRGSMATTLTAVVFRNNQIGVAHVGDCRVYHIHNRTAKCLTTDHTYLAFHQRMGLFNNQEAAHSPLRGGLTRSVGMDPIVTMDFAYADVVPGDYIVMCCDGVHVYVTEGELVEIVTHSTLEEACDTLLRLCEARGTEDNISAHICRIDRTERVEYHRGVRVYKEAVPMSHELEVGDVLDDRFEINEVISRSGMATVFKAMDRELAMQVAIKVPFMQFESDPAFHTRFLREEQIGRAMNHPSILKIIPVEDEKRSRPYIVMELLRGKTLGEVMKEEKPMSVSKAMRIGIQVCDALAHMHERDIVHRDLKPQNIMVCEDGTIRIMDFGIAKAAGMRRLTFAGFSAAVGTPDYMAPEQVKGRRGDQRTDIYSLGAILYEMVTGRTPFEGQNPFMIMQARLTGDPEAPTKFNRDITNQFEEIILHAMERDRAKRYASAKEMEQDLREPDKIIITGRVDRLQRPMAWKSRWRYVKYALLVLLPIALVALGYVLARMGRH